MRTRSFLASVAAVAISSCTTVGGGPNSPVSGSAGPAGSQGTVELHRCPATIATISIATEQQAAVLIQFGLPGNPLPAIRTIAQQSNCFRIVNRDIALQTMETERALAQSGQLKQGSNFGGGQVVAADYTIMVEVLVNNASSGGVGAAALGFVPYVGGIASLVASGVRFQEAQVQFTLIDNHTSEQITTATGHGSGTSFSLGGGAVGFPVAGAVGGYMDTDQGKVVMAAMIDGLNQLEPQIEAMRNPHTPEAIATPVPTNPAVLARSSKPTNSNTLASAVAASAAPNPRQVEITYWNSIKDSQNTADFEAYLNQYPKGDFASIAKNRIVALTPKSVPAPAPSFDPKQVEITFWDSIKDSKNPADYEGYLKQYPSGSFVTLAQNRIVALAAQSPVAATPAVDPREAEIRYWNSIKDSHNPADYQAYLKQYPSGSFVAIAKNRIAALGTQTATVVATTALAATTISDGLYPAHTKFEATNGGPIPCGGGFDLQVVVLNGKITIFGRTAPIKNGGAFELHYMRPDGNAANNVTGSVKEGSISGIFVSEGRTTTCTYSFSADRQS